MKVIFENDGEIDIDSLCTFGISAKNTSHPIGKFGTGSKYAIAILMRENCSLEIFSGTEKYTFGKKQKEVRGKNFSIITMNGINLSFTTHLGINWEMWQAFRELYCNALDEGGKVYTQSGDVFPEEGKTFVVVEGGDFLKEFKRKDEIVLNLPEHMRIEKRSEFGCEVYNKPSSQIYYRGVMVSSTPSPCLYTYNIINEITLTEDRTIKYDWEAQQEITLGIANLRDENVIKKIITSTNENHEHYLSYSYLSTLPEDRITEEFLKAANDEWAANNDSLKESVVDFLVRIKEKKDRKNLIEDPLDEVELKQLKKAINYAKIVCKDLDEYKIFVAKNLGASTMAYADAENKRIILSKKCFFNGTKYLCSTIIEEYIHLETGYGDHTRHLQTYLFDTICTLLEKEVMKEPL